MPVDRLVFIAVRGQGDFDNAGVFQPDPNPLLLRKWATPVDLSVDRTLERGGVRGDATHVYRVRWTSALARARLSMLTLWDEYEFSYTVTNVNEQTGRDGRTRRRWLELECTRDTTARPIPAPELTPSEPDDMVMMMAAPTFTELATATVGNAATSFVRFTDNGALRDAWNSGTYWAFLVSMVSETGGSQHTALLVIRTPVPAAGALSAYFPMGLTVARVDRIYLRMSSSASTPAVLSNDAIENMFLAGAAVKIWGLS